MTRQSERVHDFGGRLRALRESRGVTLRDIAEATNNSVAQLEALERNEIKRLPGGIFLRAIVRSYAQEIGADPESTVRDFIASFPGDPSADIPHLSEIDYEKATTPRRGAWGAILIALITLMVAAALVIWWRARMG